MISNVGPVGPDPNEEVPHKSNLRPAARDSAIA